ncbi:MAG: hypothetical protein ABSG74_03490 [Candidatus Bathyarchaeia archaeon]|jgi:hypothetical protein
MVVPVWEKATGDKGRFGLFGIGFNYAAKTGYMSHTIVSGAVTLGVARTGHSGDKT